MRLLEVEGLTKKYPKFTLKNVSFSLEQGRIMGLIGKNGAGKSTTLKSMLNMVYPDKGCIKMLGHDFRQDEEKLQTKCRCCFREYSVLPRQKTANDYRRDEAFLPELG